MRAGRVGWLLCGLLACGRAAPLERPGAGVPFYYPGHLALSPDGRIGYLVNTNFNQRFSSGWITSFDVAALMNSADPQKSLLRQAFVPSMGGALALSADGTQAVLPHRGSGLVTGLDLTPGDPGVGCAAAGSGREGLSQALRATSCDRGHLLDVHAATEAALGQSVARPLLRDPQAAVALPAAPDNRLAVGFAQASWLLTLVPSRAGLQLAQVLDLAPHRLAALLALPPGPQRPAQLIGASQHFADGGPRSAVVSLEVASLLQTPQGQAPPSPSVGDVSDSAGGQNLAAIAVDPAGQHVYAIGRAPNALLVLRQAPLPRTPVPGGPALPPPSPVLSLTAAQALGEVRLGDLLYLPRPAGDVLVASGVDNRRLYVFDPQGDGVTLLGTIPLDVQGPFGLLHARVGEREILWVSGFYDHSLSALDLSAASPADARRLWTVRSDLSGAP